MNSRCIACNHSLPDPFSIHQLITFSLFHSNPFKSREQWLCADCINALPWLNENRQNDNQLDNNRKNSANIEHCEGCWRRLAQLEPAYVKTENNRVLCYDCVRWNRWQEQYAGERFFLWNRSALAYHSNTQELIHRYKFQRDERLRYFFASILLEVLNDLGNGGNGELEIEGQQVDLLVPVPLSAKREFERGFNQTHLISEQLADTLQIPYEKQALIRKEDETKQSKKNREERLAEMLQKFLNNFSSRVDIHNKNILLLDDIYTTGSTLYAAAYCLKQGGASRVMSLTLAR